MFIVNALVFYIGAIFHRDIDLNASDMFTSIFAIMYAAMGAGNNNQFMGDIGAAKNAAKNIFAILDRKDEFQLEAEHKNHPRITSRLRGDISFKNVTFKYPSRDKIILHGVSFDIKSGQKVAFVGPSGCGKSSIMQLVQRFYTNYTGEITIDGVNIKDYDLLHYRSNLGVVSQEPTLFNATIKENIEYNNQNVSEEQLLSAA